jgi:hypothetical protein
MSNNAGGGGTVDTADMLDAGSGKGGARLDPQTGMAEGSNNAKPNKRERASMKEAATDEGKALVTFEGEKSGKPSASLVIPDLDNLTLPLNTPKPVERDIAQQLRDDKDGFYKPYKLRFEGLE